MKNASHYKTLGIPLHASQDEVKKAYRKLALTYHPDINPLHEEKFKEILHAYQVITGQIQEAPTPQHKQPEKVFVKKYNKWFTPEELQHLRQQQVKRAQHTKQSVEDEKQQDYQDLLNSRAYKSFNFIAVIAVLFAILMFIDYYGSLVSRDGKITEIAVSKTVEKDPFSNNARELTTSKVEIITNNRFKTVYFYGNVTNILLKNTAIQIFESQIFGTIEHIQSGNLVFYNKWINFRNVNLVLAFIYLIIVSLNILCKGPTPFYYLLVYASFYGIPITLLFYLWYVS